MRSERSYGNYVCFDCRESRRNVSMTWSVGYSFPCSRCGKTMTFIGKKCPVPKMSNDKKWDELQTQFAKKPISISLKTIGIKGKPIKNKYKRKKNDFQ